MDSVDAKTALLLDGWYTISQLARIVETGECMHRPSTATDPESVRSERVALARAMRSTLLRCVDIAEAFDVYSEPSCPTTRHRVHVEGDMATGVEFAQEV